MTIKLILKRSKNIISKKVILGFPQSLSQNC